MKTKTDHANFRETALITGASGGLGYEFAKLFARNHFNLVLVARSGGKLDQIAHQISQDFGVSVKTIAKDLSVTSSPEEIFSELKRAEIEIDILVNNAGFATYGFFSETDLNDELKMMQLNMVTLTHLTKLILTRMKQRERGKILNIASTAAFQSGPLMAVYYASKAYVLSFSEALSNELNGTNISVSVLCPGPTKSGFQQRASMEESKLVSNRNLMDAKTVARIGYQGLMANKTIIIPGLKNRLMVFFVRFLPRRLIVQIVRNMQAAAPNT